MQEYIYDVVLQTELGPKCGTMRLSVGGDQVIGFFDILQRSETCHGEVDDNGICTLRGQIRTLMRVIPYKAAGYLDSAKISLVLQCEQDTFEVTGTARPREVSV